MKNANEYVDEIGKLFDDDMHGFRSEVYRIVSAIRAEALKEAADRAIRYVHSSLSKDVKYSDDNLRADIYAGEVKQ
jgi:hypothetical protein